MDLEFRGVISDKLNMHELLDAIFRKGLQCPVRHLDKIQLI